MALLVFVFFIGCLSIGFGKNFKKKEAVSTRSIFLTLAPAVALAVLYYWANLFVNGL